MYTQRTRPVLSCTKCRCSCMLWSLSEEAGQVPVATSAGAVVAPGTSNRVGRAGAGSVRICSEELAAVSNYSLGRLCTSPSSGDALCQPCTITISVPSGCRCCCSLLLAASCAQLPARVGVLPRAPSRRAPAVAVARSTGAPCRTASPREC